MKIQSLKVFQDLADTHSFTKAARLNDITQSAVSQQVSALEGTFQCRLVERARKRFRLTPHGELFYEASKELMEIYRALETRLAETRERVSGHIRLATIHSIGLHDLPPCVKQFLQRYPHGKVHVEYRLAHQVYRDVLDNEVDFGLVAYPINHFELQNFLFRKEPLVLICHPQNPLAKRRSLKLKALSGQRFVSFETGLPTRRALDRAFRSRRVAVNHVLEIDNIETLKQAVEIDAGVAIVPESTISRELATGTLAAVRLEDNGLERPLAAVYKRTKVLSPAMKEFLSLLKQPPLKSASGA